MKCNKCHEEMKLKEIEVGKDSAGNPIYNLYAFCYHCKTKVNIDKLKKAAKERKEAEQLADAKSAFLCVNRCVGFFFHNRTCVYKLFALHFVSYSERTGCPERILQLNVLVGKN